MTNSIIDIVKLIGFMPQRSDQAAEATSGPRDIREMLMYRLTRLATIGERTGQLRISRKFGLNVGEWRVLGAIHALAPVTLAGLAGELYLDKGQLSRTVSGLIEARLVSFRANASDRRQALYETTAEGRRLHDRVLAFVALRNDRLMSALTPREQAGLFRLLDKLDGTFSQSHDEIFGAQAQANAREAAARAKSRKNDRAAARAAGA